MQPRHIHEGFIRTTKERLWETIVSPELARQYLYETAVESDFEAGSPVVYLTAEGEPHVPHRRGRMELRRLGAEDAARDRHPARPLPTCGCAPTPGGAPEHVFGRGRRGRTRSMPRALWSGAITFGLVNVPVRLYSAVKEHKLQFRLVHVEDEGPIGYQKICKLEEKPVPDNEIVKAFEYKRGELVYMEDEDFQAARADGGRTIDITDFVPYADIDPIYFAHTYYLGPQDGAEKVYALLVRAMEDSELAAIAKFVMRDRQHLGALRVRERVLTLEQLHFADEILSVDELRPRNVKVGGSELEMAEQLIASFGGEWDPSKYKDTYRDELARIIEAKRKGKDVHRAPEPEEERPVDLLEALRASVEAAKGREAPAKKKASARKPAARKKTKAA